MAAQCVLANINMDMVGEDTVKTNSRFYFTRAPDSVPFFLNAVMSDVLQQTREADLYAQTGTRNYWNRKPSPTHKAATTMCFSDSAFPPPCSVTIPTGLTTPAKTKSIRPTPASSGASAHSLPQRHGSWQQPTLAPGNRYVPAPMQVAWLNWRTVSPRTPHQIRCQTHLERIARSLTTNPDRLDS